MANEGTSPSPRENLVQTAVKFLQNPKVSGSPLKQKQEFLKRKGLTDEEIKRACELSYVTTNQVELNNSPNGNEYTSIAIPRSQNFPYPHYSTPQLQSNLFYKIKEYLNVTVLFGATVYCIYMFYKRFIEPFLFGRKKPKTVKDSVSELDETVRNSMNEMKNSIAKVEDNVNKLTQRQSLDPTVPLLVQELKQDLAGLKTLLLSRKQFPSSPASIPSWQLETANPNQGKQTEREDDAGSGSSTNNSDSSLEMIREDSPKE